MTPSRFDLYRRLSMQLGPEEARQLIDRLQISALTYPESLQEMEAFMNRRLARERSAAVEPVDESHPQPKHKRS
jgi:hypothetical protein